jgi:putative transposase
MENGYTIHALEVVNNHVHLFLEFHPSNSLSEVIQYLKGGSSYRLFKLHPDLKKRYWGGSLWSSGKFYRSVDTQFNDKSEENTMFNQLIKALKLSN